MKIKRLLSALTAIVCISASSALSASAEQNEVITIDGYDYEYWEDPSYSDTTFVPDGNGGFDASWSTDSYCFFSKGLIKTKPNSCNYNVSYDISLNVETNPEIKGDNSIVCAYAYYSEPMTFFYVTDSYTDEYPLTFDKDDMKYIGNYTSNGNTYDIYYERIIQRSIAGYETKFDQFFSVRRDGKIEGNSAELKGSINMKDSFDAIEKAGYKLGTPDVISMNVEAFRCKGSAKLKSCEITEITDSEPDIIAGDLNGDERVDSFDVVLCRQEIVNVQNDSKVNVLADIDKNGKVQVNDLVLIANFVLGKKTYIS